ncbi:MAG: HNH endonuclease family protein [Rhodobacteraceae bacterium]|nr:HNH endonuclease family protein [Paracoccaceae bacterium]
MKGASADALEAALSANAGESIEWPTDRAFSTAWKQRNVYNGLSGQRCVHILKRLNDGLRTSKMENVTINGQLTIEHLMPQNWYDNWPLADGKKGKSAIDLILANDSQEFVDACERRDKLVHTVGNLTLMTQPLNSSVSNRPWLEKRQAIESSSMLPISVELRALEKWDEEAIQARSERLLQCALKIWPGSKRM